MKYLRKLAVAGILIFSGFIFNSCSQKNYMFSENGTDAQELIFQQAKFSKTGVQENPQIKNYYYPEALNHFFFRHTLENDENRFLIEKYYPNARARIDTIGFYSMEDETGAWVDEIIDSIEEERLGAELFELLENELEMQPPIDFSELPQDFLNEEIESENQEEIETSTEADSEKTPAEIIEKRKLDRDNRIKILEFGQEIFIPQSKGDSTIIVHRNDKYVMRNFYDNQFRLTRKETWKITDFENSKLEIREDYIFDSQTGKTIEKITTSGNKSIKTKFNESGKILSAENYEKIGDKNLLKNQTNWKYDKENRVIREDNIENHYENETLIKSNSKTEVYNYKKTSENSQEEIPPEYEYYEDEVLKIKTDYSSKDEYTTTIHFDDQFTVISYYQGNKKIKDVYTVDGVVRRTKVYE